MDIEVLPVLARRERKTLELKLILLCLDHCLGDRIIHKLKQVLLGQRDYYWSVWHDCTDLLLPLLHVFKGFGRIGGHANDENVCLAILDLSVDVELLISACIVNFDLNLSTFHIFGAFVDI